MEKIFLIFFAALGIALSMPAMSATRISNTQQKSTVLPKASSQKPLKKTQETGSDEEMDPNFLEWLSAPTDGLLFIIRKIAEMDVLRR